MINSLQLYDQNDFGSELFETNGKQSSAFDVLHISLQFAET